ncbi:MAG: indolepyruvate ferredoxin oxidoreductase family protein, partial [Burkholderiaceae bacterium]|nr:indolepyruvate ferredoxin oxidoreductase family protein [Burkholderiaceae bacterium]
MNAPLPEHIRQALETVTLDDKYSLDVGRAFMSGVQALVKLPMLQRQRDALVGKNTAGFISGYRGSPLGGYDQALWKARKYLQAQHIVFQPGVNEELAATALWGTQQLGFAPPGSNRFDGVFGIWYGKGPGVDRCSDVFKHANIFKACGTPVFFPASVQEVLDFGVHGLALSRFAGLWSGMKTIQEIVESSATAMIDPKRVQVVIPEFEMPPGGLHIRWPDDALTQEARMFQYKWYAALAYIRANRLNHDVISGPHDRFGLIASGKAYNDTRQALLDLGLDDATCQRLGIRLHKVGVVWPLEPQSSQAFARGLQEILVVEEKRQFIEYQIKEELYNWPDAQRPRVLGKFNETDGDITGGEWSIPNPTSQTLLRPNHELNPPLIAQAIATRLKKMGLDADTTARIDAHLALIRAKEQSLQVIDIKAERQPWFCSGCPHNTSTKVPEGSRAMAGIGCHFMSVWMDRSTVGFTQMGGEGVPWVGQQPFCNDTHVFANIGDGTYFHSGLLAIRQSIAAGVNITYKILYNDAVAMTGGQPVGERPEGHTPVQIAQSMRAEGAQKITIVTDEPHKYEGVRDLPPGIEVQHRDRLDAIQREFREIKGCTVILYDQTCATEKRRRRKRGTLVDPALRVVINEAVCEGCGDCSDQSNCMSVEPLETEFGRKRTINQSTCNKDTSCLKGFCPSFITVEGGQLKKKAQAQAASPFTLGPLPEPTLPNTHQPWGAVVAGVGGTGVITIGQLLGMAAHLEGRGIVTQDSAGLAQKGGSTWAHVYIADRQEDIRTTRVSMAAADLILGCDPIVSASKETVQRMRAGRTRVALNGYSTPTAAFVKNGAWQNPAQACVNDIGQAIGNDTHPQHLGVFDANAVATQLMGDSIFINPMILGYAWQRGWIPLGRESLLRAIELNEVAVEHNKQAFEWGRQCAHDGSRVQAVLKPAQVLQFKPRESLEALVERRAGFLVDYQNAAYAQTYRDFVAQVQGAEAAVGKTSLTDAVARNLFKRMAYKDEYEVARLHSDPAFQQRLRDQFEGDFQLKFHLAPPLLSKTNERGELIKQTYGPWMLSVFGWLARFKGLRGTAFDIFGKTEERHTERALIQDYRASIEEVLRSLNADNHALAVDIARLPDQIKGYGHVKARHLAKVRPQWERL